MKLIKFFTTIFLFAIFFVGANNNQAYTQSSPIDACLPTQPPPACNATCVPGTTTCPQDCPNCKSGATGYTCQSAPSCNSSCTTPADCTGARNGCTSCVDNKCQVAPTPTPKVPACNSSCTTPADCTGAKDSCTSCISGKCSLPPSPTPTPDPYNDDMCKCDGLETTAAIEQDKPITITAYGKVLAADDKYAKISTIKFMLLKGNGNNVEKILETEPLPAQKITSPADIVRYSASWTFDIPQPIEKGVEYRIATTTKCAKNTAARLGGRQVAAVQDQNRGFFGAVADFFAGIFGGNNNIVAEENPEATPTVSQGDQLKLGTFEPLKSTVLENNNCNLLRFKFESL